MTTKTVAVWRAIHLNRIIFSIIGFGIWKFYLYIPIYLWPYFLEKAYEEQQKESDEDKNKPTRPDLDLEDLSKRISQVAVSDDTSSLSTRERACSDGSQDLTSMAEGEMGDLEDNQPDSSAPEDEQTDLSAQQRPIGECCSCGFVPITTKSQNSISFDKFYFV